MDNDDEWDGESVHYCTEVYQSSPSATMACGKILSTWNGKHAHGTSVEDRLGYSFMTVRVTCAACREQLEKAALASGSLP